MRLLIFKVNQLGDNVVYLPVVQHLREALPDWELTVFTSPVAEPLYLTACPGVEVRTFATADFNNAWKHPARFVRLLQQTRALRPDACLLGDDQGNVAHALARLSGAGLTVGPLVQGRHLGPLLHHRVPIKFTAPVVLQNWQISGALLEKLGAGNLPAELPPAPTLEAFGRESHGGVLIHAGASRAYKRWSLDRYVALANRLVETQPVLWINQDAAEEASLSSKVRRVQPGALGDFIRLMAGASLFIGNNSGPMNLASALGIPGIILNGPSATNWDPVWHREGFDILRDPDLPCQPCDGLDAPVNHCLNTAQPMACMDRWSVDVVHQMALVKLQGSQQTTAA